MSSRRDDPADLTMLAADDALLDVLGRGGPAPDDDKLAGVLALWRAGLDDEPADFDVDGLLTKLAEEPDDAEDTAPLRPAVPADEDDGVVVPMKRKRWRPGRRSFVGVAAAVVLFAGLGAGAGFAGPDSPLWPIAQVLYPERADVRLAEHNIALARAAADDGRYADARRTLDRAAGDVDRIDDRELAAKLRAQIAEIRRTLPPTDAPSTPAPAASSPSPSTPAPAAPTGPAATGGGQPGGGQPGGGQPGGGDPGGGQPGGGNTRQPGEGIIPEIPGLPTPTLPIPVPTLPIPDLPLGPDS